MMMRKFFSYSLVLFSLLSLSACAVVRDYQAPELETFAAPSFKESNDNRIEAGRPVAAWWNELEDEQLSSLVEQSLVHNHDVRIAVANLQQARAFSKETRLDRLPTVEAQGNAIRQQVSRDGVVAPGANRVFSSYDSGFDAIWELDLFGRISQRIESSRANLQASQAELHGVYVTVAAEVARTYIVLRGAQSRLNVAQRNAQNQQTTYQITIDLIDAGRGNELDMQRALAQLELTRSLIPALEAQVNGAINRLGVLTGKTPDALHGNLATFRPLPSIPIAIQVGDPMSLLKRRPDIRQAERELAATVAQYNLNVADLYPSVTLFGSLGFSATSFSDLGSGRSSTFMFGPRIDWAAFNLGRVKAQISAADARTQASIAAFEKSVLVALEETDTAMVNFSRQEQTRTRLFQAATASAKADEYAKERFDAGIDNFLDVLDAERTLLEAQDRLAQSETDLALNLIAIYKTLGGGWNVSGDKFNSAPTMEN